MAWPMLIILAAAVALLSEAFELVAHFIHLRGVRIDRAPAGQKPTLILPLTGAARGFEALIDRLNRQTQPFRRLIVAVESTGDPAHDRVQDLRARARFEIDLVIAGIDDTRGQKCTNIIAAVKSLAPEDRIVVFIDGDILPQDWWLATQITPLADDRADVVTGYRWPVGAMHFAPAIFASIDRMVAMLPGWRIGKLVWGGAVSLRRETLDALDVPRLYDRVLSDDMTMGRAVHEGGYRFVRRRALLLPTLLRERLSSLVGFAVRQYQIMWVYRPWSIAGSFAALAARLATWVFLAVCAFSSGIAAGAVALIALSGLVKWWLRHGVGGAIDAKDSPREALWQAVLAVLQPAVDLFHLVIMARGALSRRVAWGHVIYDLRGPDEVAVYARVPHFRARRESAQV